LRQGLLYYSQETLSVLASAAGQSKNFNPSEVDEMLSRLWERVPEAVEAALARDGGCVRATRPGEALLRRV
jgi:hypothetical protein